MSRFREGYTKLINNGPVGFWGHLVFLALWPFSLIFQTIVLFRSFFYAVSWFSCYEAAVPVISVGNLSVGGTGKTPVVDALVKRLVARGKKVAVVSRGYGGTFKGDFGRVTPEGSGIQSAAVAGDEPFLLAVKNPEASVYVARKRRLGVAAAEADGAECIVLDDAFQHLAVARDLDIVLLDGRHPFGNGFLLPAGSLREPRRALKRADLLILTHCDARQATASKEGAALCCDHRLSNYLLDAEGHRLPWTHLRGKRCLAFAGIARPDDFFSKLLARGCNRLETMSLADHQDYGAEELQRILAASREVDFLLTTEKDAVKLQGIKFPKPCLTVPLELEFDQVEALDDALDSLLRRSGR